MKRCERELKQISHASTDSRTCTWYRYLWTTTTSSDLESLSHQCQELDVANLGKGCCACLHSERPEQSSQELSNARRLSRCEARDSLLSLTAPSSLGAGLRRTVVQQFLHGQGGICVLQSFSCAHGPASVRRRHRQVASDRHLTGDYLEVSNFASGSSVVLALVASWAPSHRTDGATQ